MTQACSDTRERYWFQNESVSSVVSQVERYLADPERCMPSERQRLEAVVLWALGKLPGDEGEAE